MSDMEHPLQPPGRLRALASWQVNKVSTLSARLTAQRMQLGARTDFAVLAALEEYGALSQAEIGRRLGLDRNDVNGVLNRLESHRQVDRQTDPTDRRRNLIRLTPVGEAHLEELQRHTDAVQDTLLAGLTPEERQQLSHLLSKLLDSHQPQSA
ncbi:MarR family transcriptional regulator [Streptomyces tauricus]|uniref:MarR family winged helix-turn-helix transcriptional regulator n=1 Tax=Streptomyces tauricus TaxID=68274 RepID=UPI0016724357|nr:MarR family transcriptional regulator [Streptomyces tauricus]GHA08573.1 MarR family transcriptional regulator [Streptomyces tauricus]